MIHNWGLLLLGVIQIGTGLMVFSQKAFAGIAALPGSFSHYRYMLTALWISVGTIYTAGALFQVIESGAVLLGAVNTILEIMGYWMGVRAGLLPTYYAILSTIVMGAAGLICLLIYLR